jgi:hypothetical protein
MVSALGSDVREVVGVGEGGAPSPSSAIRLANLCRHLPLRPANCYSEVGTFLRTQEPHGTPSRGQRILRTRHGSQEMGRRLLRTVVMVSQ